MNAGSPAAEGVSNRAIRLFYVAASIIVLVMVVWGFQLFYFHGQSYPGHPIPPPTRTMVIIHAAAMTLWVLLLLVQSLLVTAGRFRTHMLLGRAGVVLAGCIVVSGLLLAIKAAVITPPEVKPWGLPADQFLAVPVSALTLFTAFVAIGIANRHRAAIHRNCMLLATISATAAAISRIDPLSNLYLGTVWQTMFGPFLMTAILLAILTAAKSVVARSFDRFLAAGCLIYAVASILTVQLASTRAWIAIAGCLMGN